MTEIYTPAHFKIDDNSNVTFDGAHLLTPINRFAKIVKIAHNYRASLAMNSFKASTVSYAIVY